MDPLRLLHFGQYFLLVVSGLSIFFLGFAAFHSSADELISQPLPHTPVPTFAFEQPQEAYKKMGTGALSLTSTSTASPLISVKHEFFYLGENDRPDKDSASPTVIFGSKDGDELFVIPANQRFYLVKNDLQGKSKFQLSSKNSISDGLWLEISPKAQDALFRIGLNEGNEGNEGLASVEFTMNREVRPTAVKSWEIEGMKVDPSLLSRHKVRWVTQDLFIAKHGGETLYHLNGKCRIDFGEKENCHCCFIQEGDCLIWDREWKTASPGPSTRSFPLLQVKKIEDRLMHFILWSPEGKYKMNLSIVKASDHTEPNKIIHSFQYLGAKSWNEWVFEVNGKRQTIKPRDWWLRTEKGWQKLSTKSDIEAFVNMQKRGELLVIEKVIQKDQQRYLIGHLFNSLRTQSNIIEIPMKQAQPASSGRAPEIPSPKREPTLPQDANQEEEKETPIERPTASPTAPSSSNPKHKILKQSKVLRGRTT